MQNEPASRFLSQLFFFSFSDRNSAAIWMLTIGAVSPSIIIQLHQKHIPFFEKNIDIPYSFQNLNKNCEPKYISNVSFVPQWYVESSTLCTNRLPTILNYNKCPLPKMAKHGHDFNQLRHGWSVDLCCFRNFSHK